MVEIKVEMFIDGIKTQIVISEVNADKALLELETILKRKNK